MSDNSWEYRSIEEWHILLEEWLTNREPTDEQCVLIDAYNRYLDGLVVRKDTASGRFRYESNGMLNAILYRLNEGK